VYFRVIIHKLSLFWLAIDFFVLVLHGPGELSEFCHLAYHHPIMRWKIRIKKSNTKKYYFNYPIVAYIQKGQEITDYSKFDNFMIRNFEVDKLYKKNSGEM
jgi:hypothetical protein